MFDWPLQTAFAALWKPARRSKRLSGAFWHCFMYRDLPEQWL